MPAVRLGTPYGVATSSWEKFYGPLSCFVKRGGERFAAPKNPKNQIYAISFDTHLIIAYYSRFLVSLVVYPHIVIVCYNRTRQRAMVGFNSMLNQ